MSRPLDGVFGDCCGRLLQQNHANQLLSDVLKVQYWNIRYSLGLVLDNLVHRPHDVFIRAAYAVVRRLSVRHVRVMCWNKSTYSQTFSPSKVFFTPNVMAVFRQGRRVKVGYRNFRPIYRFISEMIQNKARVTIRQCE